MTPVGWNPAGSNLPALYPPGYLDETPGSAQSSVQQQMTPDFLPPKPTRDCPRNAEPSTEELTTTMTLQKMPTTGKWKCSLCDTEAMTGPTDDLHQMPDRTWKRVVTSAGLICIKCRTGPGKVTTPPKGGPTTPTMAGPASSSTAEPPTDVDDLLLNTAQVRKLKQMLTTQQWEDLMVTRLWG